MHFFKKLVIFWSAKKRYRHFCSTFHPLSQAIFATATVVAFVLLCSSRFNFHCYIHREAMPTQKSAWKWCRDLSRLLALKITKGIHLCKPASLNRPIHHGTSLLHPLKYHFSTIFPGLKKGTSVFPKFLTIWSLHKPWSQKQHSTVCNIGATYTTSTTKARPTTYICLGSGWAHAVAFTPTPTILVLDLLPLVTKLSCSCFWSTVRSIHLRLSVWGRGRRGGGRGSLTVVVVWPLWMWWLHIGQVQAWPVSHCTGAS